MPAPAGSAKICTQCGVDCSNRPRTKDAQGRYFCRECYDQLAGRVSAPAGGGAVAAVAASQGLAGSLADIARLGKGGTVEIPGKTCRHCKTVVPQGNFNCIKCGRSMAPQRLVAASAATARPGAAAGRARPAAAGGSSDGLLASPMVMLLGILGAVAFAAGALTEQPMLVIIGLIVGGLYCLAVGIWAFIEAFRAGVVHLIISLFCGLWLLYIVYGKSDNAGLKKAYGVAILISVIINVTNQMASSSEGS